MTDHHAISYFSRSGRRPQPPYTSVSPETPLDPGIEHAVQILAVAGVETFESCQGGDGHAFPEPTIRFHGQRDAGWRALSVALVRGLPVYALRRVWDLEDGEPTGPCWEIVFRDVLSPCAEVCEH